MTGIVRIHVDLPHEDYRVLARSTKGEVGRLLRTLATRAALEQIEAAKPASERRKKTKTQTRRGPGNDIEAVRRLFWKGYTYLAIADELGVSLNTVYRDVAKIRAEPPTDDHPISFLTSNHREASS